MVLSSGTAAYRSAIQASIGELEGVYYVRDCFPWPVQDDDGQEGEKYDSHDDGYGLYERAIDYLNQHASSAYIMDSIVMIGGPISRSRVIQTNLASNGVVDYTTTNRRSLSIYYLPPIEQWNDEHRTYITTEQDQEVVPLPQGVETVASVLYGYLHDYSAPKEILLFLMNHLFISQIILKGSIIPDDMEHDVDLLKSDWQQLQEQTDHLEQELEEQDELEHGLVHHDHDE